MNDEMQNEAEHEQSSYNIPYKANNERIRLIPKEDEDRLGVAEHTWSTTGLRGSDRYDVVDYAVVDATYPNDDRDDDELLEEYRAEAREFVERLLFTHNLMGTVEVTVSRESKHTYQIKEHSDGGEYVVELETEEQD